MKRASVTRDSKGVRCKRTGNTTVGASPTRCSIPKVMHKCSIHGRGWHYKVGDRQEPRCVLCNNVKVSLHKTEMRKKAIAYAGGSCIRCGYNKYVGALEFHHRDPSEKEQTISRLVCRKWEIVKAEVDKCDLLCANCHREVHGERYGS
jgi:hypothetical protein